MKTAKKELNQREIIAFLEQMQGFHRRCLQIKGRSVIYGELYEAMEDVTRKLDNAAEILTGDRRFLYSPPARASV